MNAVLTGAAVLMSMLAPAANSAVVAEDQGSLHVQYALLVGTPERGAASVSVLVPGTVVLSEPELLKYSEDLADLKTQLKRSYRLESLDTFASTGIELKQGREHLVEARDPSLPGGDLAMAVTLIAAAEESATFRVRLLRKGQQLAEPVVKIKRGGRGIVGSSAGPERPVFLLLAVPLSQPAGASPKSAASKAVQLPKVLVEKKPQYTRELMDTKLQGEVVLTCIVGTDGRTSGYRVVETIDERFNAQAIEALRQWVFEPGRDASGKAVPIEVTIQFTFSLK
jgi:protein TonB